MVRDESSSSLAPGHFNDDAVWNVDKLPSYIQPEFYTLHIQVNLEEGVFTGEVSISTIVTSPHNVILLHSAGLKIQNTRVFAEESKSGYELLEIENAFEYPAKEYWVICLTQKLVPGKYSIHIVYSGVISTYPVGLNRNTYLTQDNQIERCFLSMFYPKYARYAFPCFDEPFFKAKFVVNLVKPSEEKYIALSSMPEEMEIVDYPLEGLSTIKFFTTPLISTHSVFLFVGTFTNKGDLGKNEECRISVYSQVSILEETGVAKTTAESINAFYNTYLKLDNPTDKIDILAIPDGNISCYNALGVIACNQSKICIKANSNKQMERIVGTLANQIACMWVGNLVTLPHQDHWLKEGIVRFLGFLAAQQVLPNSEQECKFICQNVLSSLRIDENLNAYPIMGVNDFWSICGQLPAKKGASLIRMFHDLKPEGFRNSLSTFINDYKYTTAKGLDFWNSFRQHVKSFDVARALMSWVKKEGYPLVRVLVETEQTFSKVTLQQERCLGHKNKNKYSTSYAWDIPIKYITSVNTKQVSLIWLTSDAPMVTLEFPTGMNWLKFNWHQVGFYRVLYPADQWCHLTNVIMHETHALDPEDRSNLIDDAFSLAKAKYLSYNIPFDLVSYLRTGVEDHYLPWAVAISHFKDIYFKLKNTEIESTIKRFLRLMLKPYLKPEIWEFEDSVPVMKRMLNIELITMGCWLQIDSVMNEITGLFNLVLEDKWDDLHPDIRALVCTYGNVQKYESTWEKLWSKYSNEKDKVRKSYLLTALIYSSTPEQHSILLSYAFEGEHIPKEQYYKLLNKIDIFNGRQDIVWEHFRMNWTKLKDETSFKNVRKILKRFASYASTEEQLKEIKTFFENCDNDSVNHFGKLYTEIAENNIQWPEENSQDILEWLLNYFCVTSPEPSR